LALFFVFTIFADEPLKVLDYKSQFLTDLVRTVYSP